MRTWRFPFDSKPNVGAQAAEALRRNVHYQRIVAHAAVRAHHASRARCATVATRNRFLGRRPPEQNLHALLHFFDFIGKTDVAPPGALPHPPIALHERAFWQQQKT